jgi:uncharacterized membrane protein YvlD (DUF360 family)
MTKIEKNDAYRLAVIGAAKGMPAFLFGLGVISTLSWLALEGVGFAYGVIAAVVAGVVLSLASSLSHWMMEASNNEERQRRYNQSVRWARNGMKRIIKHGVVVSAVWLFIAYAGYKGGVYGTDSFSSVMVSAVVLSWAASVVINIVRPWANQVGDNAEQFQRDLDLYRKPEKASS